MVHSDEPAEGVFVRGASGGGFGGGFAGHLIYRSARYGVFEG